MKTIFVVRMSTVDYEIVQLMFSNYFDGLKTTVGIKTCLKGKFTSLFIVNKRLTEAIVMFLIDYYAKDGGPGAV